MVKGISRQVIVVQAPEPKLFEQAIFILRGDIPHGEGVTDEMLLKEAGVVIRSQKQKKMPLYLYGPVWAAAGAVLTAAVWALSLLM